MTFSKELIAKIDSIIIRGLSHGIGHRDGQMCLEAALCYALDRPHGEDPGCVPYSVRAFSIRINDSAWSSPEARAKGLRDLGIAQLGSLGAISDTQFAVRMATKTHDLLIPEMKRHAPSPRYAKSIKYCDDSAEYAVRSAKYNASAEYDAATAASGISAKFSAACAAEYAEYGPDFFLNLSSALALDVLRDLKSPGCEWL